MKIPGAIPPRNKHRSSLRGMVVVGLTTTMVATGGLGIFPDNPLTQSFQEVISANFSADFLKPFNSYMGYISVPTIASKLATNPGQQNFIDILSGNESGEPDSSATATPVPVTITVIVPTATNTATSTQTPTPTSTNTLTATPTFTLTNTLTPTASTTPTYLPTWTRTREPTEEDPPATQCSDCGG